MPVAIVTGSSRGIGRGIALRLASDGFDILVNDIDRQKSDIDAVVSEIKEAGGKAIGYVADVSQQAQIEAMVQEAVEKFGELNVMVANAGVLETSTLLEMTVERWDRTLAINTRGVFLSYVTAAKHMIKQGKGGKLIGACSITGYRPSGKAPAYCTSKWAVRGLTQTAALEFGQYGISVNAYCPGSIKTNMSTVFAEKLVRDQEQLTGKTGMSAEETYLSSGHRKNALNKEILPEDMAGLISFLAGKDSSGMTGQTIIYDGGE